MKRNFSLHNSRLSAFVKFYLRNKLTKLFKKIVYAKSYILTYEIEICI